MYQPRYKQLSFEDFYMPFGETIEQIKENPYLQYFIGLESYQHEAPFDGSMLTYFRKRLNHGDLATLQEKLRLQCQMKQEKSASDDDEAPGSSNKGKLIVDATCAPADIAYPTDLGLLNNAREKSEIIIDKLHRQSPGQDEKPRTYRKNARKDFLRMSMQHKNSSRLLQLVWKLRIQELHKGTACQFADIHS